MSYTQWFFTGVKVYGTGYKAYWDGTFVGTYPTRKAASKALREYQK
jgi:hypothetical protein